MNPWREEKDGGETLLPLPDGASLHQLTSAEEGAVLGKDGLLVCFALTGEKD